MSRRIAVVVFAEVEDDEVADPHNVATALVTKLLGRDAVLSARDGQGWRVAFHDVVEVSRAIRGGYLDLAVADKAYRARPDPFG